MKMSDERVERVRSAIQDISWQKYDLDLMATAAIAECFKWQPIETAPKDGSWVIVVFPYSPPMVSLATYKPQFRRGGRGGQSAGWRSYHERLSEISPTHWMPLPEPPK